MGAGGTREEQKIEAPTIRKRWKPVSLLGGGAFGKVIKVKDKHAKGGDIQFYALKCIPHQAKGVTRKQQAVILNSAKTEISLLKALNHDNVVKYYEHFDLNRAPWQKNGGGKWMCIVIEYCHGSDLNELLKKSEGGIDGKEMKIPRDLCIFWFIKLVKMLSFIHGKSIIHRDLKPDNILVTYESLQDYKNMELKLTDFGVAKDIGGGKLGRTISGQLFYTAPEVLKMSAYDSRCDIWSLGLIFLQVFCKISIDTYQESIQDIFKKIKTNNELRKRFLGRYKIKSMENVSLLQLLNFMHEKDLFTVTIDQFVKDAGVKRVLDTMICPYDIRLKAKTLLRHPIIQTWEWLLDREGRTVLDEVDMVGVITFLKIPDSILFTRCLELLKRKIISDVRTFMENNGVIILFKRLHRLKEMWKKKFLKEIIDILLIIILHLRKIKENGGNSGSSKSSSNTSKAKKRMKGENGDSEEDCMDYDIFMRKLVVYFRVYEIMPSFFKMMAYQDSPSLYYMTALLVRHSQTLQHYFSSPQALPVLIRLKRKEMEVYRLDILRHVSKVLNDKQVAKLLTNFPSNDVRFLRKNRYMKVISPAILPRLTTILKGLVKSPEKMELCKKDDRNIISLLSHIIFCLQNFDTTSPDSKLHLFQFSPISVPKKPPKFKHQNSKVKKKMVEIQGNVVTCNFKDRKQFVEVVSSESLTHLPRDRFDFSELSNSPTTSNSFLQKEKAVCYYEVEVLNGGVDDDLFIGFRTSSGLQILLHCDSGTVGLIDFKKSDLTQHKFDVVYCETGSVIGCGITNKGNVFFTKDNHLYPTFIRFVHPKTWEGEKKHLKVYASVKLNGNYGFQGRLKFQSPKEGDSGKFMFRFNVWDSSMNVSGGGGGGDNDASGGEDDSNGGEKRLYQVTRNLYQSGVSALKKADPGAKSLKTVMVNFSDNIPVQMMCHKINKLVKGETKHDMNEILQELYDQSMSYIVDKCFSESEALEIRTAFEKIEKEQKEHAVMMTLKMPRKGMDGKKEKKKRMDALKKAAKLFGSASNDETMDGLMAGMQFAPKDGETEVFGEEEEDEGEKEEEEEEEEEDMKSISLRIKKIQEERSNVRRSSVRMLFNNSDSNNNKKLDPSEMEAFKMFGEAIEKSVKMNKK